MKELKQLVETDDAKKMGYGEYTVLKKLKTKLRKRGKESDRIHKELKVVMKKGGKGGDDDHKDDDDSKSSSSSKKKSGSSSKKKSKSKKK